MSTAVHAFVRLVAKTGREEAIKDELLKLVQPTRLEDGNRFYEIHQSFDQPAILVIHDGWESDEALRRHQETEPVKAMLAAVEPLLAEPITYSLTHLVSDPAAAGQAPAKP